MRKILIIWCIFFFSLLIRKRGQIWWRCHANSITTCYLMYSLYINTNLHRLFAYTSAASPLAQSGVGGVTSVLFAQSKARI